MSQDEKVEPKAGNHESSDSLSCPAGSLPPVVTECGVIADLSE